MTNSPENLDFNASEFEEHLAEVEGELQALKDRYQQVKDDQAKQAILLQRQQELEQGINIAPDHPIKTELHHIKQELQQLELRLESHLFNWRQLREPFWQTISYTGLGVLIGYFLAHSR